MNKKISNFKFQISNFWEGFTLIELLVVISILGLLAGLVISNMAGVRERARDAERKSDLKEIQNALEMYKHDKTPPQYPTNAEWVSKILEAKNYMKKVPDDPLGGTVHYSYVRTVGDSLNYTLRACLENSSDAQGQTTTTAVCSSTKKFELNAP